MNETNQPDPTSSTPRLDPDEARELLSRTEQVRRTARADQQGVAIPLLVLGPLTVGAAVLNEIGQWVEFHDLGPGESRSATPDELAFTSFVDRYWGTVGAVGLLVIGVWFGWRSRRHGVGSGAGAWIAGAVGVYVLFAYSGLLLPMWPPLTILTFLAPSAFIAVALLLIAWRRHNLRLALWILAFGVVTVMAGLFVFANRLYDLLGLLGASTDVVSAVGGKGDTAAQVILGVAMFVVGWRAHRSRAIAPPATPTTPAPSP
ncbi:hypothetical protein GCM10009868_18540 [Terrabacter aerolatus]|uniref:Uncharacterized protein n=1 Tax=Terrabacter aerolatus TaxID=422442 RepID=A0A512CZT9_9MICO|nr:hypothetical protein [Terrabacter aerolatus]GEO29725.1 hypothetical protein TAE01_15350 [Terrabacter aerolatus]